MGVNPCNQVPNLVHSLKQKSGDWYSSRLKFYVKLSVYFWPSSVTSYASLFFGSEMETDLLNPCLFMIMKLFLLIQSELTRRCQVYNSFAASVCLKWDLSHRWGCEDPSGCRTHRGGSTAALTPHWFRKEAVWNDSLWFLRDCKQKLYKLSPTLWWKAFYSIIQTRNRKTTVRKWPHLLEYGT